MKVGVVAVPGCFDSGLTAVLDVVRAAEVARPLVAPDVPALEVSVVGAGADPVPTQGGLLVPVDRLLGDDLADLDLLVVPALGTNAPGSIEDALARPAVRALRSALVGWRHDGPTELAAACSGTFVLADAGLLDGRRATTSWWLTDTFRHRYPEVELDEGSIVVRDGPITTAGAAFAHVDLALSIVRRASAALAAATAGALLIDERPSHEDVAGPGASLLAELERWARTHLDADVGIADAAAALGVHRRTLERRVASEAGIGPAAVLQRLRLERADHLRRTTTLRLGEIARRVGYASAESLGAALRRRDRGPATGPKTGQNT